VETKQETTSRKGAF